MQWIEVALRCSARDRPVGREVADQLALKAADGFKIEKEKKPGQSTLVTFVDQEFKAFADEKEPWDSFESALDTSLKTAAQWLQNRPAGAFDRLRQSGVRIDIFVGGWIENDQFDLNLPSEFLLACGTAGLPISIVTND